MKYYAVKKGREIGIFTDWKIVQPIIKGFKGAEYKSFKTKNEAQEYFEGRENTLDFEITKKLYLHMLMDLILKVTRNMVQVWCF